jgi:hypothetical protein
MQDLTEIERDAQRAAEALASLAARLSQGGVDADAYDYLRLRALAEEGGIAAARVLEYLRLLRGAGDGVATPYPPRLGPWREWCPPRGHVLGMHGAVGRRHRRGDPGE